jgi:methionine synthase II (cobalamin-independent)
MISNRYWKLAEDVKRRTSAKETGATSAPLWVNPDCGLNHLPRDVAFGKLRAMVAGTHLAKQQLVHS